MDFVINGLAGWLRFRTSFIILLVYILASTEYSSGARNEIRCGSIDIRNTPFYGATIVGNTGRSEIECTIVEGDFSLSMITEDGINNDMYPVFKDLREITGALLVFQVKGLTTLSKIFPNLRVIGGHSLIMNYALVIYQNQDLRNVGLTKLSVIKNGGVRIAENSRLCYTRNINWDNMIVGNLRDIILDTAESQCQDQCVVANESRCYQKRPGLISCWNASECQSFCQHYKNADGTFGPGCTDSGEICHPHCLGGCTAPNDPGACHTCKDVEIHGICAEACPDTMYEQLNRRCLTKEQCYSLKPMTNAVSNREEAAWKAFMGKCHYDCPNGYKEDPDNPRNCQKCPDHCPKKCKGDETVDSAGAAAKYRGCNIIDGSLEIEIRIGNEANVEKFAESFEEIEEITGYLMIRFSSVFVSLHMFKRLRVIHGNHLWRGNYALVVFDNQNLRELFNVKKQSLTISKGRVQFQNNRMLCYQKIVEFLKHIDKFQDVTEFDVSAHSNGEKAVCDEVPLEVEVTFVYSDGFSIRWTPFNTSDMDYRKFIGYQIFYKKVDKADEDLSVDEDRSACADTWKMQFSDSIPSDVIPTDEHIKSHDGGALISQGIEANTLYAFYVQTRIVNHPGARNAISRIHFVRTHFGNPDPPRIRVYRTQGPDRIELQWDPPLQPQGVITHYTVQWQPPEQSEQPVEINGCEEVKPPRPVLVSKKTAKAGTCSAKEGCCDCSLIQNYTKTDEDEALTQEYNEEIELNREERDAFENAIQNKVFVQDPDHVPGKAIRNKRHIRTIEQTSMDPALAMSIANKSETAFNISLMNVSDPSLPSDFYLAGKLNITGNRLLLTGLPHFREYVFLIYACQDINEPDNSCSARPAWATVRTAAIPKNDRVNPETIQVLNATNGGGEYDRRFNWLPPDNPNGVILAYQVKLYRNDVTTAPLYKCVNRTKFLEDDGITFSNLAGGTYTIEVRTVTLAGPSPPAIVKDIIYLYVPIMSKKTLFIVIIALSMLLIVVTAVTYFIFRYYCKKIKEDKVHHLLSSNPEYLSQIDVYKKDEWELPREKISIGKEIGSGTFGKVYRGIGNGVVAVNGSTFGECAVKTISENNANMDRFHFLIEASVMKQFNTNFIVKLYGVVSDTPVLVIMELMEKGNLRDFLRAHRPGSEENAGSRYNLPTADQYYKWGAQIADGMAYLENLRFCHRDLAARNCMVHADESVKIGDFGMARDIYYREYYKPQGRRLMPIRWLSPESLKDGKFTLKSDVWSFGVVLYEMLTLGQQPYAGLANSQVFNYVCIQKRIMVKPKNCPNTWYNMMRACWMYDARDRPCFWQIVDYLRDVTNEDFQKKSFVFNEMNEKRPEPPYEFDRQWPPTEEATSQEGSIDEVQEPAPPEQPTNVDLEMERNNYQMGSMHNQHNHEKEDDESASSCSCSECSGDENHSGLKYMDPMQKHNIRNYLDSVKKSGAGLNSISAGKANARDTDCLLDDSDEDDFPNNRSNTTSTYLTHSSPSTSRMGGQPRRTIDSDDKQAIRKAILAAQTKSTTQQWLNENNDDADPTDYLMTIAPAKPQNEEHDGEQTEEQTEEQYPYKDQYKEQHPYKEHGDDQDYE